MTEELASLSVIFTEFYYWVTIVFMFLIHVGFCLYEVGVSRRKNHLHTLMKNAMVIPLITVTFFLFGWWVYFGFQGGPGIVPNVYDDLSFAKPWSEFMAPHLGDRINGVFFGAFLLFSWTIASILSGAVIERIQSGAFWMFAILIGSFMWVIDAAWGWSADGWMVQVLGYHDAYASGVIHAIGGGAALAMLYHLGPRIGRFRKDGTARDFPLHNQWMVIIGLFIIYTGFWGFYVACNIPILDVGTDGASYFTATTIYLTPVTLSGITFNFFLSLSGGLFAGYYMSKGNPYWTFSGGLAGVITASAGNDLYHPLQAFVIGIIGVVIIYKLHYWVEEKFQIDDAVGAVAVHGYAGVLGVIIAGFVLWGYPSSMTYGVAINPFGQIVGAIIMFFVLGFLPAFILGAILKRFGMLRIPYEVELAGLDLGDMLADEEASREILGAELEFLAGMKS